MIQIYENFFSLSYYVLDNLIINEKIEDLIYEGISIPDTNESDKYKMIRYSDISYEIFKTIIFDSDLSKMIDINFINRKIIFYDSLTDTFIEYIFDTNSNKFIFYNVLEFIYSEIEDEGWYSNEDNDY